MAHEFVILDTSGVTTTYNNFDDIPQDTILAVIKAFFDPSLIGTKVEGFEILLESATFDEDRVETFCFEDKLPSDGNLLAETGDFLVQESNVTEVTTQPLVAQDTGTPIGNMTAGGGLAAAFDGDIENYNAGAQSNSTSGNIGKDFGSGVTKKITGVIVKMLGNMSIDGGVGTETMTLTVERSDNGTDFTTIFTESGISVPAAATITRLSGFSNTAAARYARISISHSGGAETHVSELEFYEEIVTFQGDGVGGDNILVSMVEQFQTFTPLDGSETSFTSNPISDAELGDNIVLDGTDGFGADAGGALLVENYKDGRHRLALENYPTDHLVLEEADETEINQPFLHFNPVASVEADDLNHHTEEEHRELAKLQYQLLSLNNKALENKDVFKTLGQ